MLSGWGGRSRTLTYGTRNRCPTIRRHPNNYAIENAPYSFGASSYISGTSTFRQAYFSKNSLFHDICYGVLLQPEGLFMEIPHKAHSSLRIVTAIYSDSAHLAWAYLCEQTPVNKRLCSFVRVSSRVLSGAFLDEGFPEDRFRRTFLMKTFSVKG